MRYVAAYLLAAQSGKAPSKDDIKKILGSVGIECEESRADLVVSQMAGKKVDEVIAAGENPRASTCVWPWPLGLLAIVNSCIIFYFSSFNMIILPGHWPRDSSACSLSWLLSTYKTFLR